MFMEEVGEVVCIIVCRYGEQSEKEFDKGKDLGDELVDVLFVLICLVNQIGVDLEELFWKNLEKKFGRDGECYKNNFKLQFQEILVVKYLLQDKM